MVEPAHPVRTPALRRQRVLRNAGLIGLAFGLAQCGPQCAPPPPAPAPIRYDVQTIATGLQNPWDLAWTPTGELLVTERTGDINLVSGGSGVRIGRPTDVVNQGEGGMMGLAVDPGFASNGFIYACYLTTGDVRVVRFTVGGGFSSLDSPQPLITGLPRTSGRHSGCRPRISPVDGLLYVTTGDAAVGTHPQDLNSLGGKVLRVQIPDGAIPADNPFPGSPVWALGFRNPQGITFRGDGVPFVIEHGSSRDDEITPVTAGGNGGWNPDGSGGYNESVPMTDFGAYPGALRPVWSSGNPTIAPSGGTFVTSDKWGTLAGTHIAMAVLKDTHLRLVNVTNGASSPIVDGFGRIRVAVEGPDGNLWLTTDANPGRILVVTPVR